MLGIIDEGAREKIYDFADTVHNIPEIFLGVRDFCSFGGEIEAFRKKYGTQYFRGMIERYPRFAKKS